MADFTIGRLSKATGVHIETIRYYEKIGLIPKTPRSDGGRRLYDGDAILRLRFIRRARDLGFALDDVRSLMGLATEPGSCVDAFEIAERHRLDVRSRIADLRRLERRLAELTKACQIDGDLECGLLDALSRN
ncbi:helix-turn-helix domain-containing protein [Hyphomonas sp.]|uniref:MerR family transcriptional regulator n=1 Tax=Hyphomonas sp. TaxID=87 RepID=UPI00356B0F54